MTTPDLSPADRDALEAALHHIDSSDRGGIPQGFYDRLVALRDACPERPALEDGIYEMPDDEDGSYPLRYVRDGRYAWARNPDGTLYGGSFPLPADVSTWRRIDDPPTVTPEQIEAAARAVAGYTEGVWASAPEQTKDRFRTRVRDILAAVGIEVSE